MTFIELENIYIYNIINQSLFSVNRKLLLRIRTCRVNPPENGSSQPLCQRGPHRNFGHRGPYRYALYLSYVFQEVLSLPPHLWNDLPLSASHDPQSQI